MQVQRAPIVLTVLDGRLVELWASEAVREHEGASFTWGRLWSRDLVRGDSALVHEEPIVRGEAAAYARTHRDDPVLDEGEAEDLGTPPVAASATLTLLDVAGPLAGLEVHVDRWRGDSLVEHDTRWLTVDLARRAVVPLRALVGDSVAGAVRADARRALATAADDAARAGLPVAGRAASVLRALAVDDDGFAIDAVADAPAVRFLAHVPHPDDTHLFVLPPRPIPAPAWWAAVAPTLPHADPDTLVAHFRGDRALVLETREDSAGLATVRIAGGATLLRMAGPVRRLLPIAPGDTAARRALQRAFAEAGYYSDDARAVRRVRPRPTGPRLRSASFAGRPSTRAGRRSDPPRWLPIPAPRVPSPTPSTRRPAS